jgi:outer membrane murein-binding lipoprotein Lpp
MGMKQYGLAKDTLAANKAQFERNFEAQRRTTNAALEDRQRARVASNPGAYQSVGDYMDQNQVR